MRLVAMNYSIVGSHLNVRCASNYYVKSSSSSYRISLELYVYNYYLNHANIDDPRSTFHIFIISYDLKNQYKRNTNINVGTLHATLARDKWGVEGEQCVLELIAWNRNTRVIKERKKKGKNKNNVKNNAR